MAGSSSSSAATTPDVADTPTSHTASRLAVLLFTDIVGSTELKSRLGAAAYSLLLTRHDAIFKAALTGIADTQVINDTGDGYLVSFAAASDAVRFALRMQRAMHDERWSSPEPLRVSIGVHLGEITQVDDASGRPRVIGLAIDVAGRLTSVAGAGQILLTRAAFDEARQFLREYPPAAGDGGAGPQSTAPPLRWVAHGDYRIKGTDEPLEIFEVGGEGIAPLSPPPNSDHARRMVSAAQEETLGWRPAVGLEVPQRVGWVLEGKLGEGTFGEVWLAHHERTKEKRVFKFCFDLERLHSFKRELTFFRLLRDALGERRDIARLYDVRLDQPPFFLESEYAPGGNLLTWAESQGGLSKVPLATRLELVAKVADAVAAAHSIGILHKDIKPGNILLHVDGDDGTLRPQLGDFGIGLLLDRSQLAARHITEIGFTGLETEQSSRTGTRMYAPPESLTGRPFTTQGDIYALGVLLYQLVVADLARPLASGWERDVDDDLLREDVARCVDGEPHRRLQSATELAQRLRGLPQRREALRLERASALASARRRRLYRVAGVLVLACVVLTLFSTIAYLRERGLRQKVAANALEAQLRTLDNLLLAGDSLTQAGRYAEAVGAYEEANDAAGRLNRPTLAATSGLLEVRRRSPGAVIYRRPTTRSDARPSPVVRVRVSPNGRFLLAGDAAGRGFVLEMPTARAVAAFPLKGWGSALAFGVDGRQAMIGTTQGQVQLWDPTRWTAPVAEVGDAGYVHALALAPTGDGAVSVEPATQGRTTGKLCFWSLSPLRRRDTIDTDAGLLAVGFSPDGRLLATGDEAGRVHLRDPSSGEIVESLAGHTGPVRTLAFVPDGGRLLSGGDDKIVRLWDVTSRKQLMQLPALGGSVREICVSRDGRKAALACADETVRCWDLQRAADDDDANMVVYSRHRRGAQSVEFLPAGDAIVSSGDNGTVAVWPADGDDVPAYRAHSGRVSSICLAADGLTAFTGGWDRVVTQTDVATGRVLRVATVPEPVWAMALAPDGQSMLIGGGAGMLGVLKLADLSFQPVTAAQLGVIDIPPELAKVAASTGVDVNDGFRYPIASVAIAPHGGVASVGGSARTYGLLPWPPSAGSSAGSLSAGRTLTKGRVLAQGFTPDGARLVLGDGQEIRVVEASSRSLVQRIPIPLRLITSLDVAPDGSAVAVGGFDSSVRVLDLATGAQRKLPSMQHLGPVRAVRFFPDGKHLVSAGNDDSLRLWDAETGKELRCLGGHADGIGALAVSRDGRVIISGSDDGMVRVWDLSRPARYREAENRLPEATRKLDIDADDTAGLSAMGEWYALRDRNEWAIQCLSRAQSKGAAVSPLMMARCYWKLGQLPEAAGKFREAIQLEKLPTRYLNLCLAAVMSPPAMPPASPPATGPINAPTEDAEPARAVIRSGPR